MTPTHSTLLGMLDFPVVLESPDRIESASAGAVCLLGTRPDGAEGGLQGWIAAGGWTLDKLPWPAAGGEANLAMTHTGPGHPPREVRCLGVPAQDGEATHPWRLVEFAEPTGDSHAFVTSASLHDFVGTLAHECRNPLNAIMGSCELLLDTIEDEERRSYAELARRGTDTLLRLINSLLDIRRIEAGTFELENRAYNLMSVLERVVELVSHTAQAKKLPVTLTVDPFLPINLVGDEGRLEQILLNLASNAVKFTASGEVAIKAWGTPGPTREEPIVHLTITDTGPGMSGVEIEGLFKPFAQFGSDAGVRRKGVGLGLAISRELARRLGGDISATSSPGQGSTFHFTYPARTGDMRRTLTVVRQRRSAIKGRRLLLVEKNLNQAHQLQQFAVSWGMEVLLAKRPSHAMALLAEAHRQGDPVEIVLCDYESVEDDVPHLLDAARPGARSVRPPFIWMVNARRHDIAQDLLSNVAGSLVLFKPIRHEQLLERLAAATEMDEHASGSGLRRTAMLAQAASMAPRPGEAAPRLLLVDDQPDNLRVAQAAVAALGYSCDIAISGEEALDRLAATPYVAVLMDLAMPGMDGYTTTQVALQKLGFMAPPIIALTGHVDNSVLAQCAEVGMRSVLAKPIDRRELERTLKQVIPPSQCPTPAARPGMVRPPSTSSAPIPAIVDDEPSPANPVQKPNLNSGVDDAWLNALLKVPLLEAEALRKLADLVGEAEATALIPTLSGSLCEQLPQAIRHMADAAGRGAWAEVEQVAHMYQSRAGNLGARRIQRLCSDIQGAFKAGENGRLPILVERLRQTADETILLLAPLARKPG